MTLVVGANMLSHSPPPQFRFAKLGWWGYSPDTDYTTEAMLSTQAQFS